MGAILWLARRDMTAARRLFLVMMILLGNLVAILPGSYRPTPLLAKS